MTFVVTPEYFSPCLAAGHVTKRENREVRIGPGHRFNHHSMGIKTSNDVSIGPCRRRLCQLSPFKEASGPVVGRHLKEDLIIYHLARGTVKGAICLMAFSPCRSSIQGAVQTS